MRDELVGRLVVAVVTRIEAYGLYLEYSGKPLLVLIPDVSYESTPDLHVKYRVGDEVAVRVLDYIEEHRMFKGTIKDA